MIIIRLIDFHTHAFPDGLAEKAITCLLADVVKADMGFDENFYSDGTVKGLSENMSACGVDMSVLLPVATKPTQVEGTNRWAEEAAKETGNIIPFGAVYPDESVFAVLERLAEQGRKGIKLHGDFQNFYADEERMIPIYRRCGELGLIVVMHSGIDCSSPYDIHTNAQMMARVLDKVSGVKFVVAHMGGVRCEDEAARLLAGAENVWFDTAYTAGRISPEHMTELVRTYGADKVLFASDSPWNDPKDVHMLIESTSLTAEEKKMIYYFNAERLLGL